jgi:hypothetical protein
MKPNHGYVLLWRGWMDHPVLAKGAGPFTRREAWAWLIEQAAFRPHSGLQRGQLRLTQRFIASAWNWSQTSVHRFLYELSASKMVQTCIKNGSRNNLITICNYDRYQPGFGEPASGLQSVYTKSASQPKTEKQNPPFSSPKGERRSPPSLRSEGEGAAPSVTQILSPKTRKGRRVNGHKLSPAEKLFAGFAAAAGYDSLADLTLDEPLLDSGRSSGNPPRSSRGLDC